MITNPLFVCIQHNHDCEYQITDKFIKLNPIYDLNRTNMNREENNVNVSFKLLFKFIKQNRCTTQYYSYNIEYIDEENNKIYIRFPTLSYEKALNYKLFYDFTNIYSLENASIEYISNIQHLEFNITKYSLEHLSIDINKERMKIIETRNSQSQIVTRDSNTITNVKFVNDMFIRSILAMRKCKKIEQQPEYILKQFTKINIDETKTNICSICLEEEKDTCVNSDESISNTTMYKHPKCSHVFHYECIKQWINQGRSQIYCPNCRIIY